jgi:hypothetical protein
MIADSGGPRTGNVICFTSISRQRGYYVRMALSRGARMEIAHGYHCESACACSAQNIGRKGNTQATGVVLRRRLAGIAADDDLWRRSQRGVLLTEPEQAAFLFFAVMIRSGFRLAAISRQLSE